MGFAFGDMQITVVVIVVVVGNRYCVGCRCVWGVCNRVHSPLECRSY